MPGRMRRMNKMNKMNINRMEAKIAQLREKIEKNEAFNKIPKYYINLDRSTDRREALEAEIARYEVENIHRFKAIDGQDIKDIHQGEIDEVQYVNDYNNCTKYQLAITLSHLECIRRVGEKGEFPFIVLEDDVRFTLMPHWKKNIDEIIAELPEDCDVLSLTTRVRKKYEPGIHKKLLKNDSAVAYLITEKGYNNYMKLLYKDYKWIFDNNKPPIIDWKIRLNFKEYFILPVLFLFEGLQKYSTHTMMQDIISDNRYILYV